MTFTRLLAQMTVDDLDRAIEWYTRFFGRGPDARPMDGLIEWHLGDGFGVQVWRDVQRAGRSAMVLDESDLDGRADALGSAGLPYEGPQQVTASRIVELADPDGNRIVITGA
jgi:catechol 2,3-dioxygenase-like lactoylglutathione lyase family enzyme